MASATRSWAIADWMADSSACSCARAESSWAIAESCAAWDVSRSLLAMSWRANSSVFRSKSRLVSSTATCAFAVWARASACAARAFPTSARALDLRLLVEDRGLGGVEVCPGLDDLRLEDVRIDPRDHLAFLHDRVEVDEELLDLARHLTAHLDGDDRVEVAAGRDGGGEWTELSAGEPILRRAAADLDEIPRYPGAGHDDHEHQQKHTVQEEILPPAPLGAQFLSVEFRRWDREVAIRGIMDSTSENPRVRSGAGKHVRDSPG